jgi:hydrogenase small subunit
VQWAIDQGLVPKKPVINLPTCPVHPEHIVGTIVHYLLFNKLPALDQVGRPKIFFGQLIHDNCERRGQFEKSHFLTDWNDPAQKDYCLYLKGCKGPYTYSDCPIRNWSDGLTWCIGAGVPCQGCAEPSFYAGMSPLFDKAAELGGTSVETIGTVATVVTAAGIGAHFIGQAVSRRLGKGGPPEQRGDT